MTAVWAGRKRNSIRRKLISIVMLTTVTALLLACAGFTVTDIYLNDGMLIRNLQTLAKILASNSVSSLASGRREAATEVLGSMRVKHSIIESCIYDARGLPFAVYKRDPQTQIISPRVPLDGLNTDWHMIKVVHPIMLDGRRIGTIAIVSDVSLITARLKTFAEIAGGVISLAIIVAFFMIATLHRKITQPIVHLECVAGTVWRQKDYSLRAQAVSADESEEILNLIRGFNAMLSEIERRDHDLESLVASRTAELSATKHNVELILDSAAEGIFGLDADGVATFINPSAARILGWSATDLIGKPLHEIIHEDSSGCAHSTITDCLVCSVGMKTRVSKTSAFRTSSGNSVPVEYDACAIIGENGGRAGVVVTFRDITERLAVDKMKSEFVSTVSHELRTPLTSIRGALGLLAAGLLGTIGDKGQRMLDIAISNTDRLVRLINDILDIERMEAGRVELYRRLVDVHGVMLQSVEVMQAMADREGVTLRVEPVHQSLWADPDRIVQLLTNLISNAIKFSPRGARVVVSGVREGQSFVLRVKDEGRGIPHDKLEMVFERFKQVDASDSRDKGGTGLGLAICRSIATMHGGRIWADSVEGGGSIFQFTLPVNAAVIGLISQVTPLEMEVQGVA